ncbi:hypothetical protein [Sedimenticola hydrogenitrophicus]|uniref:hypothetical protein n=1 Tax=Sedimenticola hydrogenitrophicus TaxID=2967975 RepID=UPI0021A74414|nr:hypothetical protein [Sedimenticola hydrogenitrophicus]
MNIRSSSGSQWVLVLLSLLWLTGCGAARSYQYVDQTEIPPGPGLLTGEQGGFVFSAPLPGSQSK